VLIKISLLHAVKATESYITTRLVPEAEEDWIRSTIIIIVWLISLETTVEQQNHVSYRACLDSIYGSWNKFLSSEATHSALVVSFVIIRGIIVLTYIAAMETSRALSCSRAITEHYTVVSACAP
jgi:hypothetical protein